MSLHIREIPPSRRGPDGKGELAMTAPNAVIRSIRLAGINLGGGNNVSFVQNYQRQMNSNLVDKKEEYEHRK